MRGVLAVEYVGAIVYVCVRSCFGEKHSLRDRHARSFRATCRAFDKITCLIVGCVAVLHIYIYIYYIVVWSCMVSVSLPHNDTTHQRINS